MHGADLDGRSIRVEKARRNNGYQKTPGVCKYSLLHFFCSRFVHCHLTYITPTHRNTDLGPPQLSARFVRGDERGPPRDRGYGGDRHQGGGYRGGYERERDPRDVRGGDRGGYGGGGGYMGHRGEDPRYPPAYQRGPPGGGYGDRGPPMYRDEGRYQPEPRFEPYGRGRDGPPPQRFDDRGPPRGAYYDGPRGGPPMNGGPMGPGPNMRGRPGRSRSPPPRGGDDNRGPMPINGGAPGGPGYDRNGPPSGGYGGGAGYYPPGQNGPGGPPRGGARY